MKEEEEEEASFSYSGLVHKGGIENETSMCGKSKV